jgi:hypothetical protein
MPKTYWPALPLTDRCQALFFSFLLRFFQKVQVVRFSFLCQLEKTLSPSKQIEHVFLRLTQSREGTPLKSPLIGTHLRGPTELVTELKVIFSWRARSSVSRSTWIYKSRAFKGTVYHKNLQMWKHFRIR